MANFNPTVNIYDKLDGTMRFIQVEAPGVEENDIERTKKKNGVEIVLERVYPITQQYGCYGRWKKKFVFDSDDCRFTYENDDQPEEYLKNGVLTVVLRRRRGQNCSCLVTSCERQFNTEANFVPALDIRFDRSCAICMEDFQSIQVDAAGNSPQEGAALLCVPVGETTSSNTSMGETITTSGECDARMKRTSNPSNRGCHMYVNVRALPCGHAFHKNCVAEWLDKCPLAKCPTCRQIVKDCNSNFNPTVNIYDTLDGTMRFIQVEAPGVEEDDIECSEISNGLRFVLEKRKTINENCMQQALELYPITQQHGRWEKDFRLNCDDGYFTYENADRYWYLKNGVLTIVLRRNLLRQLPLRPRPQLSSELSSEFSVLM